MKYTNNKTFSLLVAICILAKLTLQAANSFEDDWTSMQTKYKELSKVCFQESEPLFNHPYWLKTKAEIKDLILGDANPNFLYNPSLQNAMVRMEVGSMQYYESMYLKHCISSETRQKINLFKETTFGSLPWAISDFNCTVNTLGHLYYSARVFESAQNQSLNTIVEFGSGFGNLARVFKVINPQATLILIDFPELLALQYLYLKSTIPNVDVIIHTSIPDNFTPGAIHLIPVYIIEDVNLTADCFVSTFALSESTEYIQKIVADKNFFGAQLCYITGQISGWGSLNFVDQSIILKSVRDQFIDVLCQPFHALSSDFLTSLPSYDLLARMQR